MLKSSQKTKKKTVPFQEQTFLLKENSKIFFEIQTKLFLPCPTLSPPFISFSITITIIISSSSFFVVRLSLTLTLTLSVYRQEFKY